MVIEDEHHQRVIEQALCDRVWSTLFDLEEALNALIEVNPPAGRHMIGHACEKIAKFLTEIHEKATAPTTTAPSPAPAGPTPAAPTASPASPPPAPAPSLPPTTPDSPAPAPASPPSPQARKLPATEAKKREIDLEREIDKYLAAEAETAARLDHLASKVGHLGFVVVLHGSVDFQASPEEVGCSRISSANSATGEKEPDADVLALLKRAVALMEYEVAAANVPPVEVPRV